MPCLMYLFLVLSVIPFLLPSSHHVGSTSVRGASHRLDELLDDELYQVDPVLADLEALLKFKGLFPFQILFGAVVTCSQILEKDLRMDGK